MTEATQRPEVCRDPSRAAELLRQGKLVAFPTETVYGLGVDATNAAAVERLFLAKGRPQNNPLIVHIGSLNQLEQVAASVPELARRLLERFAPGPLTVVVPRHARIASSVTAGLDTVGVRIPDHSVALQMLQQAALPIAAPSANRSGKPSATTSQSVLEDFPSGIDAILDGEATRIGLESTVVDCVRFPPRVLRPGAITLEELRTIEPAFVDATSTVSPGDNSPGRLHPHYRPAARVILVESNDGVTADTSAAWIGMLEHPQAEQFGWYRRFDSLASYAQSLYESLREADRRGLSLVYCSRVAATGSGAALADRLSRAAE